MKPKAAFDAALEEVGAGHAHRARRLAEEAVRLSPPGPTSWRGSTRSTRRCARAGSSRRRCACGEPPSSRSTTRRSASPRCACSPPRRRTRAWRAWRRAGGSTRARSRCRPSRASPCPSRRPSTTWRRSGCWRAGDDDPARVLALLEKALARHPGADAALALAEKLVARVATGEESSRRRLDLLRAAHADEYEPARRARLGLAARRAARGGRRRDRRGGGARARARGVGAGRGVRVRGERARLLRSLGRPRELAAALEKDAGALLGDARLPVLAEQAELLEAAGEAERALDVRMMALAEFPGAPAVLDDARARLEATGRPIESLALADRRARSHDRSHAPAGAAARRRDAERAAGRQREPRRRRQRLAGGAGARPATDREAAAAAERLLRAVGDWERCADLLAWQVARAAARRPDADRRGRPTRSGCSGGSPSCAGNVWARPTRRCASTASSPRCGPPLAALADPPELAALARRDFALAVETARAGVAPTRGRTLARAGRPRGAARWRAGAAATPSATRWRRSISIRATPTRSRRWNRCTRASAGPASWPTSWGGAPPAAAARGGAAALRTRAGRGARGRSRRRARGLPPGDVARSDAGRTGRRAGRAGGARRATGRRSRSCSRARSASRPARRARGRC